MSEEVFVVSSKKIPYKGKVYDINVDREHNYTVGGVSVHNSAAGSEVCYLCGITNIDPLKNNLMFERFLQPARFNFPDIDIDIQSTSKRPGYSGKDVLMESLSRDRFPFTGHIVNESRATTITLFKSLAKVFGIDFKEANKVTTDSEVSDVYLAQDHYIQDTTDANGNIVKGEPWLESQLTKLGIEYSDRWKAFEKYIEFCYKYGGHEYGDKATGLLVNSSAHASGVIMYDSRDKNILPKSDQGVIYRGHDLEEVGYVKYDLLGLASLDPLAYFIPKIVKDKTAKIKAEKESRGETFDPKTDSYVFDWEDTTDPDVWSVFKKADTDFVFQFSSPGMKRALRIVQPDNISTLAELNALYRPGCINAGIFEHYLSGQFTPEEMVVGKFLKEEFGEQHSYAMIFQEDIMMIVNKMAGFTLGEADLVRRAMQRKEFDRMAGYKQQFIDNFKKDKYGDIAETVWNAIEAFAAYAFNLSHSVAYGCIAYWTAYIFYYYKNEMLSWYLNYGAKKDVLDAMRYLSKDHRIIFPTLESKNKQYIVTDTDVMIPTATVFNESLAHYLLRDFNADKRMMIVKYGVLDSFCPDRKGIRELFSNLPAAKLKTLTDVHFIELSKCKKLTDMLDKLAALDFLDYEKKGSKLTVNIYKARSVKTIIINNGISSSEVLTHNCKEDVRQFGIVRSLYCCEAPDTKFEEISGQYNNFMQIEENKTKSKSMLVRHAVSKCAPLLLSHNCINNENTFYDCVFKEAKLTGYQKVEIIFNNDVLVVGITKDKSRKKKVIDNIKALDKSSPISVRLNVSFYPKDGEVAQSIVIEEIKRRGA